jgi:ribose-phosphate pyrophosphokinase
MDAPNENAACLFALDASRDYGERVARALGVTLATHEEREFEDGEHKARPLVSVRDRDVYVIHSLYGEPGMSANDKLVRLLFFIGALKDAAAARVTAVCPYLAYARKDRRSKSRDPVSSRYVAQLFEAMGTDRIVTLEVHNPAAYQNAFRIPAEQLQASGIFLAWFGARLGDEAVVVMSPDAGGIKRADAFRQTLGRHLGRPVGFAFMEKYRSEGVLSGETLVGDVAGRTVLIYDDLVASGATLARASAACRAKGAQRVIAAAAHGVFTGAAETLARSDTLDKLVVTDTIPPHRLPAAWIGSRVEVLDSSAFVADAIRRLNNGGSLVELQGLA